MSGMIGISIQPADDKGGTQVATDFEADASGTARYPTIVPGRYRLAFSAPSVAAAPL